jgi:CRP-like cAMP-binding protein
MIYEKTKETMAEGSRIWYFEETNLFNLFCPHKSKHLGERHVFLEYQKDEFIYFEEDPSDKIYLIASGRVKIFSYNEQGEEFVKAILGKGEIFGEQSILDEGQRTDFAQAIEPTTICRMHLEDLQEMMRDNQALSLYIHKLINLRFKRLERRLELLLFKDVKTRLYEFLCDLAQEEGVVKGNEVHVNSRLTHKDIAKLIGSSRQTVTTLLNELQDEGKLKAERRRYILPLEALRSASV